MYKKFLQSLLFLTARRVLRRHHPKVIAITGSVGKTSTKEAIFAVLKHRFPVRKSEANFNNEIGVPLTILGIPHYGKNIFKWIWALKYHFFISEKNYPKFLILEMGVDHPGDMEYLMRLVRPNVAVITAIGRIPVHVEFFSGPEEVAKEKGKLVQALLPEGHAVINADDESLDDIRINAPGDGISFGFGDNATVKISNFSFYIDYDSELKRDILKGSSFDLSYEGHKTSIKLLNVFGKPAAYAAAAGAAIGLAFGMNLSDIAKALQDFQPPAGRMKLLRGIKHSFILDDSYNAAPEAMHSAIGSLRDLPGKRKIAVLGDMLELGGFTESAHRAVGDRIAEFVDLLITVGPRAKFIAEEAMAGGLENKKVLAKDKVFSFDTSGEVGDILDPMIQEGDLILVKGSQGARMEKIVESIMAEPEHAKELLVRQSDYWRRT